MMVLLIGLIINNLLSCFFSIESNDGKISTEIIPIFGPDNAPKISNSVKRQANDIFELSNGDTFGTHVLLTTRIALREHSCNRPAYSARA